MNYKGYEASIHFDEEDKIFWGEVVNLGSKSMILFHSENANQLENKFQISVDAYLETCVTTGCTAKKPFSGKCLLEQHQAFTPRRLPVQKHKALV